MTLLDRLLKQLLDEHLVVSGVWQDERIEALITEYTQNVLAYAARSIDAAPWTLSSIVDTPDA